MLLITVLMVFVTVFLLCVLVYRYISAPKRQIKERMQNYSGKKRVEAVTKVQPTPGTPKSLFWRQFLRQLSMYFETLQWSKSMEHKLIQAGMPLRGAEFMVICLALAWLLGVVFFIFSWKMLLFLVGSILGFFLPILFLKLRREKRVRAFNGQLGDSLILIANSLRTGYSFMQSIEMVAREMPAPIGEEFARLLKEMNLGVTTENALNNLAKRINSDDLDLVITAVLIQRQVGGNLAEVLDSIASTIRERVKIKGQIKTLTAQGRVSGIIVSLLPVAIGGVIFVINPSYISVLFTHPMGRLMLVFGVASQLVGIMVIRRIIAIEV
ncbi:MAG: type II secretion system F family protein [Pelosinus sp.]|nr:type II secretion system F family protein [Pelosinus sp.]